MNEDSRINLYKRCLDKWGVNAQLGMLIEECAETIQAVSKLGRNKPLAINNLVAELVDLELMVGQAKYILFTQFNRENDFYVTQEMKIERLEKLLHAR